MREGVTLRGLFGTRCQEKSGLWNRTASTPFNQTHLALSDIPPSESPSRPRESLYRPSHKDKPQASPRENPTCGHPNANLRFPHRPPSHQTTSHPCGVPSLPHRKPARKSHPAPTARPWRLRCLSGMRLMACNVQGLGRRMRDMKKTFQTKAGECSKRTKEVAHSPLLPAHRPGTGVTGQVRLPLRV